MADFVNFKIGPVIFAPDLNWLARYYRMDQDNALCRCHAVAQIDGATVAVIQLADASFSVIRHATDVTDDVVIPCPSLAAGLALFSDELKG